MEMTKLKEYTVGQKLEELSKKSVTRVQLARYAGASGDFNPLHLDDAFAQKVGMDGVIAHGMLIMGFLGEYVMNIAGQQATLRNFKMRFGKMTKLGDQITCSGIVEQIDETNGQLHLSLQAIKNGTDVVGEGSAILQLNN